VHCSHMHGPDKDGTGNPCHKHKSLMNVASVDPYAKGLSSSGILDLSLSRNWAEWIRKS